MSPEDLAAWAATPAPAAEQPEASPGGVDTAALEQWAATPTDAEGPERDASGRVYVVSPAGEFGAVDEAELPTLGAGYKLASRGQVAQEVEAQEYGDVGSQIGAGLEGVAQGATLGGYGLASSLVSPEYDRQRRLRSHYHPITEGAGEVAGAVLPALLSGGTGVVGQVARAMPSAIEANLGAKFAGALGSRAAAWTASKAAQVGARTLAMGLEGAADQAIRTVLDDAANGDVDITAERVLDAAWTGFATGSALELGTTAFGALARGASAGVRRLGAELPVSIDDAAGEAAYKAAVGRTDVKSQRLAKRVGGPAEVGKTLLSRGLVSAGDTVDDIAERLPAARQAAGEELGALVDQVAGAETSRRAVWDRIEKDVIAPLDKTGSRDVASAIRNKLESSGLAEALTADGDMPLRELLDIRRTLDSRPDLKWGSAGPGGVDLTTEAMRDVRRTVENAFETASDEAAKKAGIEGFAAQLKQAKREYSHLALAADQAEEGVMRRAANNKIGLTDALFGVAGAASMGPAGAAAAVGSKLVRDRFESTAASLLYKLGGASGRPATMLGRLADDAVRTQEAVTRAADDTVKGIFSPARAMAKSLATLGGNAVQRAMSQAMALQDPNSPASQSFAASVRHLSQDDPQLAEAVAGKVRARAAFIASKTPPPVDTSDPLGMLPGRQDGATMRKSQRYVVAALDPKAALKRLSEGTGTAEDIETLRALTPRLYDVFVKQIQERVKRSRRPPTQRERQRLAYVTGQPMSGSDANVGWYQGLKAFPVEAPSTNPNLAPAKKPAQQTPPNTHRDERTYATRSDRVLSGE